jgi:hypothetical protein
MPGEVVPVAETASWAQSHTSSSSCSSPLLLNTFVEAAATGRPWKVKAYRLGGPFPRRIHPERLPEGVEPEERMVELLDELAPSTTP